MTHAYQQNEMRMRANQLFIHCTVFVGIGDRTGPPPVTQTVGTSQGRVRATMPRAAGRSQGSAGGARQPGTSAARGG